MFNALRRESYTIDLVTFVEGAHLQRVFAC